MNLTLKTEFKTEQQCLLERAFSLLDGHCLDIGLCGLDIALDFRTRLSHYSDINAGPCSVWSGVSLWLLLKFVIYLNKNIRSCLSKGFSEAPLGEHLSHVGAMQHDLLCKSV